MNTLSNKLILAIETSCDDTCIAIVKDKTILANCLSSQIDVHALSGGVIPEVASRLHEQNILYVLDEALKTANVTLKDIEAIAVTYGPGLIGSLHIGLQVGKTLSLLYDIPLYKIHHLAGHLLANYFIDDLTFPCLGIIVSGGNSELVLLNSFFEYEILGDTLDDALGELLDKVGRVLGLPYPAGPKIDKLAKLGQAIYKFPIPKVEGYNFSYSGLKTHMLNFINNKKEIDIENICCSLQEAAFAQIINKVKLVLDKYSVSCIVLGGGVAANSRLRILVQELGNNERKVILPTIATSIDNAAMIGLVASLLINKYNNSGLFIYPEPMAKIDDFGRYLNEYKKS
jgi:N6-L-threonylcarbamoyladenine synthase